MMQTCEREGDTDICPFSIGDDLGAQHAIDVDVDRNCGRGCIRIVGPALEPQPARGPLEHVE